MRPERSTPPADSAMARRTWRASPRWSAPRSSPWPRTEPSGASTRKVTRRCGGSRSRSHAASGIGTPAARPSSRLERGGQRSGRGIGTVEEPADVVGDRDEGAPQRLGESPHELGHQLLAQAGHLPVEAVRHQLVQHGDGHVHHHPVLGAARVEGVAERELEAALSPDRREVLLAQLPGHRAEQLLAGERQAAPLLLVGPSPPGVEVATGHHLGRDALVVERLEGVVARHQVPPTEAVLEVGQVLEQFPVRPQEAVVRRPVPLDQGVAQEQLPCVLRVDASVADQASADEREPVEGDRLVGHGLGPLGRPVGLAVGAPHQVRRQLLGPLGLDAGDGAGEQPGGLHQLGGHDPLRRPAGQRGPREDDEAGVAGPEELAGLGVPAADVGEQARQQGTVDPVGLGGRVVAVEPEVGGHAPQLRVHVLPLAHPEVVEVLAAAQAPELVGGQRPLLLAQVAPQVQVGEEVRRGVGEAGVEGVGLRCVVRGSLAGVLDRQPGGDHQHLGEAPVAVRLEDHAPEAGVDREPGEAPAERREPLPAVAGAGLEGAELLQEPDAVVHRPPVRRVEEREGGDVAQADGGHLQDDRRQVRAQHLRLGELGPGQEVVFVVEPDADAVGDPPAAARPLVRRRLRDRLDGQPLHLQPVAVPGDPRRPRVDHVADARARSARSRPRWWPARSAGRGAAGTPGAARRWAGGRRAGGPRCRGGRGPAGRRRCRGSPARRRGTRARRRAPRGAARGRRRRCRRSGRAPRRRARRRGAGSGPRPGRSDR